SAFWTLVLFIQENGNVIDGEVTEQLDTTEISKLLTFSAANNGKYVISTNKQSEAIKKESLFSFLIESQIVYDDIREIEKQLAHAWTTTGFSNTSTNVNIISQADYMVSSSMRLSTKVSFSLKSDGVQITSNDVQDLSEETIAGIISSSSLTKKYSLVSTT
ncbi:hypothetical protein MAR_037155, partial [Mya arenaria]